MLLLAHLRNGDTYTRLAAGFAIGTATAWRYVREVVDLLAALVPDLPTAAAHAQRLAYAILDGTLIPTGRVADQKPYYSGKHKRHGVNVQVSSDPAGRLAWASPELPGAVHDLTAARVHGQANRLLRDPAGQEFGQQLGQPEWVDPIGGRCQFGRRPPSVTGVVCAFVRLHAADVDIVRADAVVEEVVADHAAGRAEIGAASGVRDRLAEVVRRNGQTDLFMELAGRGVLEWFAVVDAAARGNPAVTNFGVRGVDQKP